MQWWCAARGTAWTWSWQPYPGVWLFVLLIGFAYWRSWRAWTSETPVDRSFGAPTGGSLRRGRPGWFVAGILCMWLGLDWPIGALGAGYLASVHMVQFLLIALVAPPLMMLGMPAGRPAPSEAVERLLRPATNPLVALVFFNLIIILTHLPSVVDSLMASQPGSFAIDLLWLLGGAAFWWPVILDRPPRPRFAYPVKIGYLILATIVNAGTFLYLTFSQLPVYATYELAPPVYGISAIDDQRVAGLLMKVGTAVVLWIAIGILFYLWYRREVDRVEPAAGQ